MKIIKPGIIPPPRIPLYRGKCDFCRCEIEVTEKEIYRNDLTFECPTKNCTAAIQLVRHHGKKSGK